MERVWIDGELHFFDGPGAFVLLVRERMGDDAADYLCGLIAQPVCTGECDTIYERQEHYERVIRDAVDELQTISVAKVYRAKLDRAIRALEAEL